MSLRWWGFLAALITITGAVGLHFVLTQLYPTLPTQVLLLFLFFVTFSAATVAPSAYLNHRFAAENWRKKDPNRLLREASGVGLLVVILAYLQLIQALDWTITSVLFGVFILMETFFLTRG